MNSPPLDLLFGSLLTLPPCYPSFTCTPICFPDRCPPKLFPLTQIFIVQTLPHPLTPFLKQERYRLSAKSSPTEVPWMWTDVTGEKPSYPHNPQIFVVKIFPPCYITDPFFSLVVSNPYFHLRRAFLFSFSSKLFC